MSLGFVILDECPIVMIRLLYLMIRAIVAVIIKNQVISICAFAVIMFLVPGKWGLAPNWSGSSSTPSLLELLPGHSHILKRRQRHYAEDAL